MKTDGVQIERTLLTNQYVKHIVCLLVKICELFALTKQETRLNNMYAVKLQLIKQLLPFICLSFVLVLAEFSQSSDPSQICYWKNCSCWWSEEMFDSNWIKYLTVSSSFCNDCFTYLNMIELSIYLLVSQIFVAAFWVEDSLHALSRACY